MWFEGTDEITTELPAVKTAFEDSGDTFVEIVGCMAGITSVDLVEQGADFVTIRTDEGPDAANEHLDP